jgi:hypothetical protein
MNAQVKTYERKLADLIRLLASDQDGEVVAAARALERLLASRDADFNDLASAVESLATGGLAEAEMKRLFDAGYAKGFDEAGRKQAETEAVFGKLPDGSTDWEAIALAVQREKAQLEPRHHQFADDMAARLAAWGYEPSEKQGKYLLSLFYKIGGRIR